MSAILKYILLALVFMLILIFSILYTATGNKIAYFYLSDTLSEKTRLEVKVQSINLYEYPHIFGEILIEDKYSLKFKGTVHNFKPDIFYTITSNCIENNMCSIEDDVDINGTLTGEFKNILIKGKGKILDGTIVFDGVKKRKSLDNANITLTDINSTKLFNLFEEEPLLNGNVNAYVHFDTIGKHAKKGQILFDAKDNNLSGLEVKLKTHVNINDKNYAFTMDLTTPTAALKLAQGQYNQDTKQASASYVLDVKELEDLRDVLNVKLTGPFYALGELLYDKKIKMQGVSKSFGGILDIVYKQKKFHFYLDDIPFNNIMKRLTYPPLLDASMTGKVDYDTHEKNVTTDIALKKVKFIQKDIVKLVYETYRHHLDEEVFTNSHFEATFKDKVLSSYIKMENENNHIILQDTHLDSVEKSIRTIIDLKIQKHDISGQLYVRNNGYASHTLDTYLTFDGLVEKYYKLTLDGPISEKGINLDYTLSSGRLPSHVCTIVDDVNITGQIHGPFKSLYLRGEGQALEGNISYDGIKINDTLEKFTLKMNDIHALKLSTLLGLPESLPHGKANVNASFDYLNKKKSKGHIAYSLQKGTFHTLPCVFNAQMDMDNTKHTFAATMTLENAELNITKGSYDSVRNLLDASYVVSAKDLAKLETLLGHTYQGSFYAIGTMNYDDQLEVRGLSKTFGGIVDFLYKNEMLYIDLNNTSLHDITNLLDYPAIMDADTDGNINYDYKKDLLLVKAQLKNAKFLHTDIVDTVYQKSGVNMLTETFDNCSLDINYQNDILIGNLVMENQTNYLSLTNAQINTKENTIDAYFDVKMQKQEFSGKIFGPIEQPKVNLNMQKLIRYQMDKQLDSVVGKGNRKMMESMPMGGVSKDMATEVGASFMGMFF